MTVMISQCPMQRRRRRAFPILQIVAVHVNKHRQTPTHNYQYCNSRLCKNNFSKTRFDTVTKRGYLSVGSWPYRSITQTRPEFDTGVCVIQLCWSSHKLWASLSTHQCTFVNLRVCHWGREYDPNSAQDKLARMLWTVVVPFGCGSRKLLYEHSSTGGIPTPR